MKKSWLTVDKASESDGLLLWLLISFGLKLVGVFHMGGASGIPAAAAATVSVGTAGFKVSSS